jgi:hypothetical protein
MGDHRHICDVHHLQQQVSYLDAWRNTSFVFKNLNIYVTKCDGEYGC